MKEGILRSKFGESETGVSDGEGGIGDINQLGE